MKKNNAIYHLLVIDDDARIRNLLQKYLVENGYLVSIAKNTKEALELFKEIEIDLLVLDVMMPGETGIEFVKKLRLKRNNIPVLMLTAMGEVNNRIEGLQEGADDYLVKPFEPKELLLRISNLLRRSTNNRDIYYFGDFIYDLVNQSLVRNDTKIFLTNGEHLLLSALLQHSDEIVSREDLAEILSINERSVDVQIVRLRAKIEDNPSRPLFLQSIRGKGYIIRFCK
jgi:two-component system phosphate regulon response regulator OmpR